MTLGSLSALAELIGAVAIVATLAYLTIQTRQNTAAMQANTRQGMLEADLSILLYLSSNPEIIEIDYKRDISDNEKRRLAAFVTAIVRNRESQWLQHQSGGIDERTWATYRGSLLTQITRPRSRKVWDAFVAQGTMDAGFLSEVNTLLHGAPDQDTDMTLEVFVAPQEAD